MKEVFAITSYCNSTAKINALFRTIDNLKQYNLPIFLHAHYPLCDDAQKKVHSYFYSSDNPITSRYNIFWYQVGNYKLEIKQYETTCTVLKAWSESIKILSDYDRIHMVNYDTNLPPDLFTKFRQYPQSVFLQNSDTRKNYMLAIYFSLNKKSFDFFRENITMEKFMAYPWIPPFLPIIEEFVPSFTIGDDFIQVPNTEFDVNTLIKYDIGAGFNWEKDLSVENIKMFIGEIEGVTHILFFDVKWPVNIEIRTPNSQINRVIQGTELVKVQLPFILLNNMSISIDKVPINPKFIKKFLKLECKIFQE